MNLIYRDGSENFYMRKEVEGNQITVCVTNLKSLWRSRMTQDDILGLFRRQNPLLQAKSEWIMTYVHSCLDSKESSTCVKVDDTNKTLSLNLVNQASEVKVKLHLILHIQDDQEFFREVTNPLVAVVIQLMDQRSKLLALVKSKDLELREYKLEGAEITRKNVETSDVMEKEFLNESLFRIPGQDSDQPTLHGAESESRPFTNIC
uniref:Non-homologous end-joining factor 1 n=2 Tax=Lygus hesperus TaxID=30085 RepID=A0A0A9X3X2_LYGHE